MLKRGNKQLKCFYRGVFCELANASDDFRHDTKEKRICIKQPRVNVAVNFAPRRWLQFIRDDVQAFGDGLIHRFHFCSPSPITIEQRGGVKRLADDLQEPEFCLSALFLFVFNLNKSAKMFEFESEAKEFLRKRANEFRSQAQSSQSDFLRFVNFFYYLSIFFWNFFLFLLFSIKCCLLQIRRSADAFDWRDSLNREGGRFSSTLCWQQGLAQPATGCQHRTAHSIR